MKVGPAQFAFLCDLLRRRTGVVIDGSKEYLVVARLMPIVRQRKLPGLDALLDRVRRGLDPARERAATAGASGHAARRDAPAALPADTAIMCQPPEATHTTVSAARRDSADAADSTRRACGLVITAPPLPS
jgi:hypothetical protein